MWPTPRAEERMQQNSRDRYVALSKAVSPSMATSAHSTPSQAPAMSSLAASPASRSVRPGNGSARMTPVTCGHTPFAYWSSQERRWDSSRMCLDFSAQDISEPSSETWPKRGSMRNGACWEQTTLAPRIDASGCGFWPTATAQVRECNEAQWATWREDQGGTLRSTYLQDAVKYQAKFPPNQQKWLTPRTPTGGGQAVRNTPGGGLHKLEDQILARGGATRQTWPTPDTGLTPNGHGRRGGKAGNGCQSGASLEATARQMPTPTANRRSGLQSHGVNVIAGSLNPTWVEWLQGWPRGWTDCEHLVTDRCLRRWLRRSRCWLAKLGFEATS
jgi:hypothetical protein